MAGTGTNGRATTTRRAAIIAVSAALHLAVLFTLGIMVPKLAYRPIPEPPALQLRLIAPYRATNRRTPQPSPQPQQVGAVSRAHVPPIAMTAPRSLTAIGRPGQVAVRTVGPTAGDDAMHFYESGVKDCAREDLMLLSPEERIRCSTKIQTADGTGGRPIPRDRTPISGIDPSKRAAWDQQLAQKAARRDGAEAQAGPKAIQDARGPLTPNRTFDINAGFNCKFAFGVNAKKGLEALSCKGSPP